MASCEGLTEGALLRILRHLPALESLLLDAGSLDTPLMGDGLLVAIGQCCPKLRSLVLLHLSPAPQPDFRHLSACAGLRRLDLGTSLSRITNPTLSALLSELPLLEFYRGPAVTSFGSCALQSIEVPSLASAPCALARSPLASVAIADAPPADFPGLLTAHASTLRSVSVGTARPAVLAALMELPQLAELSLQGCDTLQSLAPLLAHLERASLSPARLAFTDPGPVVLASCCLRELRLLTARSTVGLLSLDMPCLEVLQLPAIQPPCEPPPRLVLRCPSLRELLDLPARTTVILECSLSRLTVLSAARDATPEQPLWLSSVLLCRPALPALRRVENLVLADPKLAAALLDGTLAPGLTAATITACLPGVLRLVPALRNLNVTLLAPQPANFTLVGPALQRFSMREIRARSLCLFCGQLTQLKLSDADEAGLTRLLVGPETVALRALSLHPSNLGWVTGFLGTRCARSLQKFTLVGPLLAGVRPWTSLLSALAELPRLAQLALTYCPVARLEIRHPVLRTLWLRCCAARLLEVRCPRLERLDVREESGPPARVVELVGPCPYLTRVGEVDITQAAAIRMRFPGVILDAAAFY
ncbi:hypothetical protein PAPYR_4024 [Paratrimastix pyriformis]|uniref:Uncharacterized protein n=1 Tax=Paratrimastix pyriformis TaxID=342808 RepID=A0ABQ8UNA4_9EUKA|nr:hypothetical protein PAPYR_4024 [Paratrimastix pyriformis]